MRVTRAYHTATLLISGKVLVAGGKNMNETFASAELYDPTAGTFTATGNMTVGRWMHTATLLLQSGKVLITGGCSGCNGSSGGYLASAELYDPATGTFTATGSLTVARWQHTATLLPSGKVLITGGYNGSSGPLASAELYDPATGTFTATGNMNTVGNSHTSTLLGSGQVLVAGGKNMKETFASAELYDPAAGTFTATGNMTVGRWMHTATLLLPSGKVLVTGGFNDDSSSYLASAELYDLASGTFTAIGSLTVARSIHTATLLPGGKVLITGGFNGDSSGYGYLASAELYDPAAGTFTATGSMSVARTGHTATLLPSGKVLITGGYNYSSGYLASTELYE